MPRIPAPRDTSEHPYVENYPPLKEWLDKHEARCIWQVPAQHESERARAYPTFYVELWLFPKTNRTAIIIVHSNKGGWDIHTPAGTNRVAETLEDAERRLGII